MSGKETSSRRSHFQLDDTIKNIHEIKTYHANASRASVLPDDIRKQHLFWAYILSELILSLQFDFEDK